MCILLNACASVDQPASIDSLQELTPLKYAAYWRLRLSVRLLIQSGASVHTIDANDETALVDAILTDNFQVMTLLLNAGAPIDVQSNAGETVLMIAANSSNGEAIYLLHEHQASIDLRSHRNWTVLMYASSRDGNFDTAKRLVDHGSPINIQSTAGETALMLLAGSRCYETTQEAGQRNTIHLLLEHAATINYLDNFGWTAPMLAAYKGHTQSVCTLLKHSASVNIRTDIWDTAWTLAQKEGHAAVAKLLMECSCTVANPPMHVSFSCMDTSDGWISLFQVATISDDAIVDRLLQSSVQIEPTSTGHPTFDSVRRRSQFIR